MQTKNQIATVTTASQGRKFNVLGHSITTLLEKKNSDGNYYVFECITPPGHGIPSHVHDREDEIISIVEGEFSIMLGGKNFLAKTGDICFFPRHTPHAFQNISTKAGKTLWTVIPGVNFEEFFDELSKLPAGEPDLQVVGRIFAKYGMEVLVGEKA